MHSKRLTKLISVITLVTFLFTNSSYAAPKLSLLRVPMRSLNGLKAADGQAASLREWWGVWSNTVHREIIDSLLLLTSKDDLTFSSDGKVKLKTSQKDMYLWDNRPTTTRFEIKTILRQLISNNHGRPFTLEIPAKASIEDIQQIIFKGTILEKIVGSREIATLAIASNSELQRAKTEGLIDENVYQDSLWLLGDVQYGQTAREEISRLINQKDWQGLKAFTQRVATRRHNIDLMQGALDAAKPYHSYDIRVLTSSTPDEAEYQGEVTDKLFTGIRTDNAELANKPLTLSVVDPSAGGTFITLLYGFDESLKAAQAKGIDLIGLLRSGVKFSEYINSGRGERASPMTQSLGNSRGAQKLVGEIRTADKTLQDLELVSGVVLQCSPFANSNNGRTMDFIWASQLIFGTADLNTLNRGESPLAKFVVMVDKKNINPKGLYDFGTALVRPGGGIDVFYGNHQLAKLNNKTGQYEIDESKRSWWDRPDYGLGYDFGSFSISVDMFLALHEYYKELGVFERIRKIGELPKNEKRDVDPCFIQPLVALLSGLSKIERMPSEIPPAGELRNLQADQKKAALAKAVSVLKMAMRQDSLAELSKTKPAEAIDEVMGFYLLYRDQDFFKQLEQHGVGIINLGVNSDWTTYRRPLDIANEKYITLFDIWGETREIQNSGKILRGTLDVEGRILAEDARRKRGISNDAICRFRVNGKEISLSFDQVKQGINIEGVYIKGSLVRNCDLLPGSRIVDSVVDGFTGRIDARDSYVQSSDVIDLVAISSVVHKVIDKGIIFAFREVISDAYRPQIRDRGFPDGQARMRAPISYDPQEKIKDLKGNVLRAPNGQEDLIKDMVIKTEGQGYTFSGIRELPCNRKENDTIEARLRQEVRDSIQRYRLAGQDREDIIREISQEQLVAETLIEGLKTAAIAGNDTAIVHISSLLKGRGEIAANLLIRELKFNDNILFCKALVACLGDIGTESAVEALKDVMVNGGYPEPVYTETARALGKTQDEGAVDILIGIGLASENQYVRMHSAESLARQGNAKAIEPLIKILNNTKEKSNIREVVAKALGNFNDIRAREALVEISEKDRAYSVRSASQLGLNTMDRIAKEQSEAGKTKETLLLPPAKEMKLLNPAGGPKQYAYFPKDMERPVGQGERVLSKNGDENNPIKPGTMVVIGAAGMIGHEAARQLNNGGQEVVTVDNLLLGSAANDDLPGVRLLRQDASRFCKDYRSVDYKNIKGIVYLGGYSSEPQFVSKGFPQWLNWEGTPEDIAGKWNNMVDAVRGARKMEKITPEEVKDAKVKIGAEFTEVLRILYNDFSPELASYARRFPQCVTQEWLISMYEFKSVMDLAKMYGIKVVFASTSSFCKLFPSGEPVPEVPTFDILDTFDRIQSDPGQEKKWITAYEFTKLGMELMAMHYHNREKVEVFASRNFSVYNAGQQELQKGRYANMVAQVIWAVENGQSVPIFIMPGDFARDVIFVSDLAKGILHIMGHAAWEGTPQNSAAVFNVGLKRVWGMNQVIASVMSELSMGEKENILYRLPTPGFPGTMVGDPTKVQGIGWEYDYPFERALTHIFLSNEQEYETAVAGWESEHAPVALDITQLETLGFQKIADNVYKHGVFTLLIDANNGSLGGLYLDRKKIGPPVIKIYQGPDLYEDPDHPTVCTKNTGIIEAITWPERKIDYNQKVVPLRYDTENRRLVILNGNNEIAIGRQLGWVAKEVSENSNDIKGSVSDILQRLCDEGILQKATEAVYLTADANVLLVYNRTSDNIELVTAKPHVGVMSDPITNSTTVKGLVADNLSQDKELCRLHIGDRDLFIDEEGRTRRVEVRKEEFAGQPASSTALMVITQKPGQLIPYGPIANAALTKIEKIGDDTLAQIEERMKSGWDRQRNFLGKEDSLKAELINANTEVTNTVVNGVPLNHMVLGRILVVAMAKADEAASPKGSPAGMIAKPVRFYDEYTRHNYEISHVMSDRYGSPFNELPPLPLKGEYKITNLDNGEEIIFQGQLGEMICRYGCYGGPGAAPHFSIKVEDLIELNGLAIENPAVQAELETTVGGRKAHSASDL